MEKSTVMREIDRSYSGATFHDSNRKQGVVSMLDTVEESKSSKANEEDKMTNISKFKKVEMSVFQWY